MHEQLNMRADEPFFIHCFALRCVVSLFSDFFPRVMCIGKEIGREVNKAISKGVDKNKSLMVLEAVFYIQFHWIIKLFFVCLFDKCSALNTLHSRS